MTTKSKKAAPRPGSGKTRKTRSKDAPQRAVKSSPWFPVATDDIDTILRTGGERSPVLLVLWMVLVRESHFKETFTFSLADSAVAKGCGIHARTVRRRREELAKTKLVKLSPPQWDATTATWKPTRYTIKPARQPWFDKDTPDKLSDHDNQSHPDKVTPSDCPIFLQSSSGGFQKPSRQEEETVGTSRGRRLQTPGGGRAKAATSGDATPPVEHETEIDALRAWQKEEYQ